MFAFYTISSKLIGYLISFANFPSKQISSIDEFPFMDHFMAFKKEKNLSNKKEKYFNKIWIANSGWRIIIMKQKSILIIHKLMRNFKFQNFDNIYEYFNNVCE